MRTIAQWSGQLIHHRLEDRETGRLQLVGEIGSTGGIRDPDLRVALAKFAGCSLLRIFVDSTGGDLDESLSIRQQLKRHSARKIISIRGDCNSGASIVATAGDIVRMGSDALMLVHLPTFDCPSSELTEEMRKQLRDDACTVADIYAEKSGRRAAEWHQILDVGPVLTASEAKRLGLVDEITLSVEQQRAVDRANSTCASARTLVIGSRLAGVQRTSVLAERSLSAAPRRAALIPEHILDMARRIQARSSGVC